MHFRPTITLTLILVTLASLFFGLGRWQLERKAEKTALFQAFDSAPELTLSAALARGERFARVTAEGRYDPSRHVLRDNQVWQGRAGVHALTPFTAEDGTVLLVNRGWLPLPPDRSALPPVPTDDARRTIRGRLVPPPEAGPRLGGADALTPDEWPQLMTYLELDAVSAALGQPLAPWIVQLDDADPTGFGDRQWSAAVMPARVHGGYAVQWFGLMTAAIVIWILLGVRRGRAIASGGAPGTSESSP